MPERLLAIGVIFAGAVLETAFVSLTIASSKSSSKSFSFFLKNLFFVVFPVALRVSLYILPLYFSIVNHFFAIF